MFGRQNRDNLNASHHEKVTKEWKNLVWDIQLMVGGRINCTQLAC